jgi:hypothetical protein
VREGIKKIINKNTCRILLVHKCRRSEESGKKALLESSLEI